MTLKDTFGLSLRNLKQARLRTAITMLGVSIGIASLAGMLSLGVGLQDQVLGRFMQSGVFGMITVTTAADLPGGLAQLGARGAFGPIRRGNTGAKSSVPPAPLDEEALKKIRELPNVRDVYPTIRFQVEASFGDFTRGVVGSSVPMSSKGEGAFQSIPYGRFFESDSESSCMISLDSAKQISETDPGGIVGKRIRLSYPAARPGDGSVLGFQVQRVEMDCPVIGIVERGSGPFGGGGGPFAAGVSAVMVPLSVARKIDSEIVTNPQSLLRDPSTLTQKKNYTSLTVKVTQPQHTQDVEERLRGLGLTAFSVDDALRGAKNAFILLDIFLSLIGSIALAVSSLGIVNTMVMSILERTREIGIMKAIGASDDDIRRIFLIEASVIGLFGGIAGIALGWLVGQIINFGANIYLRSQGGTPGTLFSLPPWLIAASIGFSILVSLVAGSYPAGRAARLDPIRALRHD